MGRRSLVTPAGPLVWGAANRGAKAPQTAGRARPPARPVQPCRVRRAQRRRAVRVLVV